ncbi:MAG: PEP-CTERM sorting domain-containing protein [Pseudomonadota bacterium]
MNLWYRQLRHRYDFERRGSTGHHFQQNQEKKMHKTHFNRFIARACLLLAGASLASPSLAAGYAFTTLPVLSGGTQSTVLAINNLGQAVGYTDFDHSYFGFSNHATFWDNNTAVGIPTSVNSYATDINDAGQVVGWSSATHTVHNGAFVWQSGTSGVATDLNTSYYSEVAYGINSQGDVVGSAEAYGVIWSASSGTSYLEYKSAAIDINDSGAIVGRYDGNAVVWSGGTRTILDNLEGGYSVPAAINNAGQVVGYSMTASFTPRATLWNGTTVIDLGSFGGNSNATGINDLGQVVGVSLTATGDRRAFLWDGTAMVDINSFLDSGTVAEGWALLDAADINDKGQIVGKAYNSLSGQYSSYLLTPVPEPETYAMMALGLAMVGWRMRIKRT